MAARRERNVTTVVVILLAMVGNDFDRIEAAVAYNAEMLARDAWHMSHARRAAEADKELIAETSQWRFVQRRVVVK